MDSCSFFLYPPMFHVWKRNSHWLFYFIFSVRGCKLLNSFSYNNRSHSVILCSYRCFKKSCLCPEFRHWVKYLANIPNSHNSCPWSSYWYVIESFKSHSVILCPNRFLKESRLSP